MSNLLEIKNLTIGIHENGGEYTAVDGISYEVRRGEILGVVGESGCGKSITNLAVMGLLNDQLSVTGGEIIYREPPAKTAENEPPKPAPAPVDLAKMSAKERQHINGKEISMVYQEPMTSLDPLMKIGKQIAEPLKLHGVNSKPGVKLSKEEIRARVLKAMQDVGIPEPERRMELYPHQLSGGMRQRVVIAIATICHPRLLIADEPTTALDVTIQKQVLALLKRINRQYRTSIVFVSHDLAVINQICDRVIVMYAGKIVETGPTREILLHPGHEYTKGLIRSIPRREEKGTPLPNIPGRVPSTTQYRDPCPFAPRCALATDLCREQEPAAVETGKEHVVYCHMIHRPEQIPGEIPEQKPEQGEET